MNYDKAILVALIEIAIWVFAIGGTLAMIYFTGIEGII